MFVKLTEFKQNLDLQLIEAFSSTGKFLSQRKALYLQQNRIEYIANADNANGH